MNESVKPPKQSKKPQTAQLPEPTQSVEIETASNKPSQDTKTCLPQYTIINNMGIRRTAKIANSSVQRLVLENEDHLELVIRGMRSKFSWDELCRAIIKDHLKNNRSSEHLFS